MSTEMIEKDRAKLERTLHQHVAEEKTELRASIQFSSERIEGMQLASWLTRGLA